MNRVLAILLPVLLLCGSAFTLFLPLPEQVATEKRGYTCVWEEGEPTEETYASVLSDYYGLTETEILLVRNGVTGRIALSDRAKATVAAFEQAELADLLSLDKEGLSPAERGAIYRAYGNVLYYDGDAFAWNGEEFARSSRKRMEKVVLLSDNLPKELLKECGAGTLAVRAEAKLTADRLLGSTVSALEAELPYVARESALYLQTAAGERLVAVLPAVTELTVEGCAFIDEGALTACRGLTSLSLPFVGNSGYPSAKEFVGELGVLFGKDEKGAYAVPDCLKKVSVSGGSIVSYAFYGCDGLEEINACGVSWWDISREAFTGLPSLKRLITPRYSVTLTGEFEKSKLDCGCTQYVRKEVVS